MPRRRLQQDGQGRSTTAPGFLQSQGEHTKQQGELGGYDSVHEQVAEQDMQQVDLCDHLPQPEHTMTHPPEPELDDPGQLERHLLDQQLQGAIGREQQCRYSLRTTCSSRETVYARRTASE